MPAGVEKLNPISDAKIKDDDMSYLERYEIKPMLEEILQALLQARPPDPIQFIVDCLEKGAEFAQQDGETGLSKHRKIKLLDVFGVMDRSKRGRLSFNDVQAYANAHGAEYLTPDEVQDIFKDFDADKDNMVSLDEFLVFFGRVSRTMSNRDFDKMIEDMESIS